MADGTLILGAGVTGLGVAMASGLPVYEGAPVPGGICASYYIAPNDRRRLYEAPADGDAYRFEIGGGHWIFGGDPLVLRLIGSIAPMRAYVRRSSIYYHDRELFVPYPLQNHLRYLGPGVAAQALDEMVRAAARNEPMVTMADWLRSSFGPTLCDLFFDPFHELYTAGLSTRIAPQDAFKSPVDISIAVRGAFENVPAAGYNTTFVYPVDGLDVLAARLARTCAVQYDKRVVRIDVKGRVVHFADGSALPYEAVVSTLPLNRMMQITGVSVDAEPDPAPSVLVVNIGAVKGLRCPDDQWVYVPRSRAGFHRVGFYSNVDPSFLPASRRDAADRVSIYVERAYHSDQCPDEPALRALCAEIVRKLQEYGWITDVEVADPTPIPGRGRARDGRRTRFARSRSTASTRSVASRAGASRGSLILSATACWPAPWSGRLVADPLPPRGGPGRPPIGLVRPWAGRYNLSLLQDLQVNDKHRAFAASGDGSVSVIDAHGSSALADLRELWAYRELLYFFVWRDVKVRYKQTVVGFGWAIIQPFFTMVVFTLFFGNLAKMPSDGLPYPVFYFSALVLWLYFANALQTATNTMVENQRVITRVYFPRVILPLSAVLSGLVDFAIGFVVLLGIALFYGVVPGLVIVPVLPLLVLITLLTAFGAGLWLSAMNAMFRDVRYALPFLVQFWMFASPVVYPSSLVPDRWKWLYGLNPMAGVIEGLRWALSGGGHAPGLVLLGSAAGVCLLTVGGLLFFRRMETTIIDVV